MAAAFVTVSALLLLVAGVAKVIHPDPASDALGALRLPSHPLLVRVGALLETGIALFALVSPSPLGAILVGASFLGFALFVALLRRQPDAVSCGCFGGEGETPSGRHVAINLALGVGCLLAAATAAPSTAHLIRHNISLGLLFLAVCVCAAWLCGLVLQDRTRGGNP